MSTKVQAVSGETSVEAKIVPKGAKRWTAAFKVERRPYRMTARRSFVVPPYPQVRLGGPLERFNAVVISAFHERQEESLRRHGMHLGARSRDELGLLVMA